MTESELRTLPRTLAERLIASNHCPHDKVSFTYECHDCAEAVIREAIEQTLESDPRLDVNQYFDEAECYFELPLNGQLEDATELLDGYDPEVRLAACAFAKAYAAAAIRSLKPLNSGMEVKE